MAGDTVTLAEGRIQFQRGPFAARAELFEVWTEKVDVRSYYVEISRMLGRHFQLAAQYENGDLTLLPGDNSVPPPLREHESIGGGVNYWFKPGLVLKLDLYRVEGNMYSRPSDSIVKYLTGTLETRNTVFVLGTQFSFWTRGCHMIPAEPGVVATVRRTLTGIEILDVTVGGDMHAIGRGLVQAGALATENPGCVIGLATHATSDVRAALTISARLRPLIRSFRSA